jgi:hypothetical protein
VPAVVPWIPASPPALVAPATAAPCRLAHLRFTGPRGVFDNGLAGSGYAGSIIFRNDGPACSLVGQPRLRFVGGPAARVHQVEAGLTKDIQPTPDFLPAPFSVRALPTGRSAWVEVAWRSWCAPGNPGGGQMSPPPSALEVTLPSGDVARFPVGGTPVCYGPALTSSVEAGAFRPYLPPAKQSTTIPLKASLDSQLYDAVRGKTLRYRVTLRNPTSRPYRFAKCPVYVEELGGAKALVAQRGIAKEIHFLNCRNVGAIAPGQSVTFAMEIHVPRTLKAADLLEWQLAPRAYSAPWAPANVVLTG